MGKVVFNMTMSLDGFVAGPNDGPGNGRGDRGEQLFVWYFTGDTEINLSEGTPVLKVYKQSAAIIREALQSYGAGMGAKDIRPHGWMGWPSAGRALFYCDASGSTGMDPGRVAFCLRHRWRLLQAIYAGVQVTLSL